MPRLRILLDECIDRRLKRAFPEYDVKTVPQMGWSGIKNGNLLARAAPLFDVLLTVDRNLSFQQHLPRFSLAVLVLRAPTNRLEDLIGLVPDIQAALEDPRPGVATLIGRGAS